MLSVKLDSLFVLLMNVLLILFCAVIRWVSLILCNSTIILIFRVVREMAICLLCCILTYLYNSVMVNHFVLFLKLHNGNVLPLNLLLILFRAVTRWLSSILWKSNPITIFCAVYEIGFSICVVIECVADIILCCY